MSTNSESRKRWEDIESAHAKNQGDVNNSETAEAVEVLIDAADAKERALLDGIEPVGVKPVNGIKHGFRECVACGATWEDDVAPVEAIKRLLLSYKHNQGVVWADIAAIHDWLNLVG